MGDTMTQNETILTFLKTGHELTALNAMVNFGVGRLAARIAELRQMGHDITTRMVTRNKKTYATYRLEGV